MRLVQGQVRIESADRTPSVDRGDERSRHCCRQARDGRDDDNEEDRHRQDAWYDNAWGYSCKLLDLLMHMAETDKAATPASKPVTVGKADAVKV